MSDAWEKECEAEIQAAYSASKRPRDDDLYGWQSRSGEWQAAWAGAHTHRSQLANENAELHTRLQTIEAETIERCAKVVEEESGRHANRSTRRRNASLTKPMARKAFAEACTNAIRALASKEKDGK